VGPVSAAQAIVSFSHPGPVPQRSGLRRASRHQPAPGQQRPDRPAPAQPRRGPGPQPGHPCHRAGPDAQLPAHAGLRCPAHRRGKARREIRRCIKRYIARELYRQLTHSMNPPVGP
jgi:hypothetical protein